MPASAGEPPSILKGFTNVEVLPGQKKKVGITLSRYDLSFWDTVAQGWRHPNGTIGVTIGTSSRDERLAGNITIA
jgi:beta-glucosidase